MVIVDDVNAFVYRIFQDRSVPHGGIEIAEEARIIIRAGSFTVLVQIPCSGPQLLLFGHFCGALWGWRNAL
jgi:hypothetical protein